jgi:hypothetical protein
MDDKRSRRRLHVISYLKVQEKVTDETLGRVVDMSMEGLGLFGQNPLTPDSRIELKMVLPQPIDGRDEINFSARVAWSQASDHPGFYDSGVQLVDVPAADVSMLEQFIEQNMIEDRWLSLADSSY